MKTGIPFLKAWRAAGCVLFFSCGILCSAAQTDESKLPPPATNTIDFLRDIHPILETSCLRCHGAEKPRSGFRLDDRAAALKGGDHGVDILPGQSAKSPMIRYVAGLEESMQMPPADKGEPLTMAQIGLLRAWIDQGAVWDSSASTNNVAAAISPMIGGTTVSGDHQKFRELDGIREGIYGGVEQFSYFDHSNPDVKITASGHFLPDDYKLSLSEEKYELGFIHAGWEQYRKYYDDIGGYDPAISPTAPSLNHDLYLDYGKAWADFGVTLPRWPRVVLGYEYDYRTGDEATLDWGAYKEPAKKPTRDILPASESVHEGTHVIKFDLDGETQGVTVEDRFRGEFYNLQTQYTNEAPKLSGGSAAPTSYIAENVSAGSRYFQGANTLRLERKFKDWLLVSGGYLYSKLNADSTFNGIFTAQTPPAGNSYQWVFPQITLERESHVLNLNSLLGPFDGLTISSGLQNEWTRQNGFGGGSNNLISPLPMVPDPATLGSDYDETSLEESLSVRYSKIPFTALFAEARLQQESIGQYDSFALATGANNTEMNDFLQRTAFFSQLDDLRVGFNTSPWRTVSFSAHYRYYENKSGYDNAPLQQPIGSPGIGYPGFITARDLTTDEIEAKLVLHPCAWFKTTLSYQFQTTDYSEDTEAAPGGSPGGNILSGRDHSRIYSVNTIFTPTPRLYLGTTFSYQPTTSTTATANSTAIVPYRGASYSVIANATYVLSQTTDLFANYAFSDANYGQNNFADGLPVGISYEEHSIQLGLTRHFGSNISAKLQYSFNYYDEPSSGGAGNFRAQSIFATLTFKGL